MQGIAASLLVLLLIAAACAACAAGEEAVGVEVPNAADDAPAQEAPSAAHAAELGDESEIEVEVVGRREGLLSISPAPGEEVTEVTAQEIEAQAATTVLEAIDLTPSVLVLGQGARYEKRLSIRGAPPRLVLLDGIPIAREGSAGPATGSGGLETGFAGRILYTLPAEIIERIDVIRTPGTIVYGTTAATGPIINIVTKKPQPGRHGSSTAAAGSFDRRRLQASASGQEGPLGYLLEAGTEYGESNLPLGEKRFGNGFAKVVYDYPDGSLLLLDYFSLRGHRTLDLSQDFSIVPPRYWRISPWDEAFVNAVYSKSLDRERTLDVVLYQRDRSFFTELFTAESFATTRQDWSETENDRGLDLRYSLRRDDGRITRAGLQWSELDSSTRQTTYIGPSGPLPKPKISDTSYDQTTPSVFISHIHPLGTATRLSVGARYDAPSDHDASLTYEAGVEKTLAPGKSWHAHLGSGVEYPLPTAGDLERGIVPPRATTLALETGWSITPTPGTLWSANAFWSHSRDARILYNDPPGEIGPTAWLSKPEDITTYGLEFTYDRQVRSTLSWFANYTLLWERVGNENLPLIPGPEYPTLARPPRHIAAAGVRTTVRGTEVAASAKYVSDYLASSRLMKTAAPVEGFWVAEFKLGRRLGSGKASLFIENLFNADYETMPAFPQPGRNYYASYTLEF